MRTSLVLLSACVAAAMLSRATTVAAQDLFEIQYYAETGPVKHFDPLSEQHHILLPAVDLNVSPDWEINFGVGRGLTNTSEHWILKAIIGYRFKH